MYEICRKFTRCCHLLDYVALHVREFFTFGEKARKVMERYPDNFRETTDFHGLGGFPVENSRARGQQCLLVPSSDEQQVEVYRSHTTGADADDIDSPTRREVSNNGFSCRYKHFLAIVFVVTRYLCRWHCDFCLRVV